MFDWFKKNAKTGSEERQRDNAAIASVPQPQLLDVLTANNKTPLGPFEDLNRDLANYIDGNFETCDPMLKMAYGYARRLAMCGLYFQGIVGHNVVKHLQDIFVGLQQITGSTIDFQRSAAVQAADVLRTYVPRLTTAHEKALLFYARQEITALDLAMQAGYGDIDDLEDSPVGIDKCIDLLDHVMAIDPEARLLFTGVDAPSTIPRLVDYVDKVSDSRFGAFANMCDDIKASSHKFAGRDPLFAAGGYGILLGRCAVFVGGGVTPQIISDAIAQTNVLIADVSGNPRAMEMCKSQAVNLARTYVFSMTPEAAEVILDMGLKFERLVTNDQERLTPEEVVLRAKRLARNQER